jgi:hypothetical protein
MTEQTIAISFPFSASVLSGHDPNLIIARARTFAASTSRFLGGAFVTSALSSFDETFATSVTARLKASSLTTEGFVNPLIFRMYCMAAAWISSCVAGGLKL